MKKKAEGLLESTDHSEWLKGVISRKDAARSRLRAAALAMRRAGREVIEAEQAVRTQEGDLGNGDRLEFKCSVLEPAMHDLRQMAMELKFLVERCEARHRALNIGEEDVLAFFCDDAESKPDKVN